MCDEHFYLWNHRKRNAVAREGAYAVLKCVYLVVWIIRALKLHIKTKYQDVYNRTKFHAPAYTHSNANINVDSNLETPIYQLKKCVVNLLMEVRDNDCH